MHAYDGFLNLPPPVFGETENQGLGFYVSYYNLYTSIRLRELSVTRYVHAGSDHAGSSYYLSGLTGLSNN